MDIKVTTHTQKMTNIQLFVLFFVFNVCHFICTGRLDTVMKQKMSILKTPLSTLIKTNGNV